MSRWAAARARVRSWEVPSFHDLDQVALGLVTVVVLAALTTGAFAVGTLDLFGDRYRLSAVFTGTGGIDEGAEVRVAGVSVGRVVGVEPDFERGQVVVAFEVDAGIDLGVDTTAEIAATTLLGGHHLVLDGPVEPPLLESLAADDPRRRIPLERTTAPISLVETLGETTSAVAAVDLDAVNELLTELSSATRRNVDVVPSLVDSFSSIASAAAAREAELARLVASAETLTTAVADRDEELVGLVDAATVLLELLAERRDELTRLLGSGADVVERLDDVLAAHGGAIDDVLTASRTLLAGVDRNLSVINTSLAYAGPMFSLLANVRNPEGGFDVAVEGFVGHPDQLRGLLSILFPELGP